MIILACGGRTYSNRDFVYAALDLINRKRGVSLLVHGAAAGADTLAKDWATSRGIEHKPFPITPEQWRKLGPVAGPMRNHRMLLEGKPDGVVAFKGGNGTADMVRRSLLSKVPVWDLRSHPRA